MARRRYPSDHRPYFRVLDAILDDPALDEASEAEFATFIRLLAMLNRAQSKDGTLRLSPRGASALTRRRYAGTQRDLLGTMAGLGLITVVSDGGTSVVTVPNWPKIQGFATASLRSDSDETPPLREEESRVEKNPLKPPAARSRVKPKKPAVGATLFPAKGLTLEQKTALATRPALARFIPAQFGHAVNRVAEWSHSKGMKRRDWVATVASSMLQGWGLEGFVNGPGAPDPPRRGGGNGRRDSTYSAPVTSPGWEEGGEIRQAFADQDAESEKETTP